MKIAQCLLSLHAVVLSLACFGSTWTIYHENHVPVKNGVAVAGASVMTPVQQITNAIAQAVGSDTVVIKPGVYELANELTAGNPMVSSGDSSGNSYLTILDKQLYLQGENTTHWSKKTAAEETVLKGGPDGRIIYGYKGPGRSCVFQNLTFEGGTAQSGKDGGAIVFFGTDFYKPFEKGYASNCVFRSNSATGGRGGATSNVSVYDSFFTNNVALHGGAALGTCSSWSTGNYFANDFLSCVFVDNVASSVSTGGGALYLDIVGRVENCVFVTNRATSVMGGAIYVNTAASSTSISNCTFVGNSAKSQGGALYAAARLPRVVDCAFTNNVAAFGGAAYAVEQLDELATSTFVGNYAASNAVFFSEGGYRLVTGCTFKDNVARDSYAGVAAAKMWQAGTVENCVFDNNTNQVANIGSQIHYAQQVTGCTFKGAGDMFALNYDRCLFDGCWFDYDKYGAGMIVFDTATGAGHVRNCLFQNSTMHVAIENATGQTVEIANCTFVSNSVIKSWNVQTESTMSDGYLIYAFRGKPSGSTDNVPSTNLVVNCAFANNYRHGIRNDACFYVTATSVSQPAGNILDHSYYETATFVYAPIQIENVTGVPPKFVANDARYPNAPYYMPRPTSRLRNAGRACDWMVGAVDFAGNARVLNGVPDIGCYECNLQPMGMMLFFH